MDEIKRDFKGVWIPKHIWLDGRLNALEKAILAEIDSLDMGESGCFASNKYIAEFCQCSETKVSTAISKLADLGCLQVVSFNGRQRILKSSLSNFERQTFKNCKADSQNLKDNNIHNKRDNKTLINNIVDYLNEKAGTAYRAGSANTQKHINARLAEGYTLDDFKVVIDKKCAEWKGTEWERYLRPETLFGAKFEGYRNAKSRTKYTQPEGDDILDGIL